MLTWVLIAVLLGAAGLFVLGALTWRLWGQVRQLGRDVVAASARLSAASEGTNPLTPTLEGTREGRRHG